MTIRTTPGKIENIDADINECAAQLSERFGYSDPKAFVHTFGCQGNVADSEIIKGFLHSMGFVFTDTPDDADLILFNTCAVREHAEDRVFGNVGALKRIKEERPEVIIVLCGCMMQQQSVCDRIKKSYPFVSIVFGTFMIPSFPLLLNRYLRDHKRLFDISEDHNSITEGLPKFADRSFKSWLPIMYGCNNFCSYCIVPYVRGRERSRSSDAIVSEGRDLINKGSKDLTLLGQNVNSYGKGTDVDFPKLLSLINGIDGDFLIRFMTSHPKDCSHELLDVMAQSEKCARHIHLPVQSGSDRILKMMNRSYTIEKYIDIVDYARKVMPDITITSDIIVGFPNETAEDFELTLELIKRIKFSSLFTFIFSPRNGTPAAKIVDLTDRAEKTQRMAVLLSEQEKIAAQRSAAMVGKTYRVLVEDVSRSGEHDLIGRTSGNVTIDFNGDLSLIGSFAEVRVDHAKNWILTGELVADGQK